MLSHVADVAGTFAAAVTAAFAVDFDFAAAAVAVWRRLFLLLFLLLLLWPLLLLLYLQLMNPTVLLYVCGLCWRAGGGTCFE